MIRIIVQLTRYICQFVRYWSGCGIRTCGWAIRRYPPIITFFSINFLYTSVRNFKNGSDLAGINKSNGAFTCRLCPVCDIALLLLNWSWNKRKPDGVWTQRQLKIYVWKFLIKNTTAELTELGWWSGLLLSWLMISFSFLFFIKAVMNPRSIMKWKLSIE